MEVHHHGSHGSGWKSYLKEFLMLFLAVLCGFFAEMKVHSVLENKFETEYIESISEDIESDIRQIDRLVADYQKHLLQMDSLIEILSTEAVKSDSRKAYRLWTTIQGFEDFSYDDRTIQQLKSGGLRLVKQRDAASAIMRYDQSVRKFQLQRNILNLEIMNQKYYYSLFDFIQFRKVSNQPISLTETGKKLLNEAIGDRIFYKLSFTAMKERLYEAGIEARNTLAVIKKSYKL